MAEEADSATPTFKVYKRKNREHIEIESNSVMESVQIPSTPAKKTRQRQQSDGVSMHSVHTSFIDDENKENLITEDHLSVMDVDEKVVDCSGLTDTNMDSFDLNKPVMEELEIEAEVFAEGFTAAMLQTEDVARQDEELSASNFLSSQSSSNTAYLQNSNHDFVSIEGSFTPVVQPNFMSQYSLKNQELVDCKYNVGDTDYIGSLKRKLHATFQRSRKKLKRQKKKVYRPKVVRNLGRPIPRMEPKTPTKKNKKSKLKTPKMKKNVSLEKTSSTIDLNDVPVPLEPIVSSTIDLNHVPFPVEPIALEREVSSIDTTKHSEVGTRYNDFDVGLRFLKKKKRTTLGKKWELIDHSRIMEPNLVKIMKKKRMGRKRWEVHMWQKIASKFRVNYLKRRYNKKIRAAHRINLKELYRIFGTAKKFSPCFLIQSGALKIEESLTEMVSLLESDSFELFFKLTDVFQENIIHESNQMMLVCQEKEKHDPHIELGIVAKPNSELGLIATTKRKGRRQEKLEKLKHGELAHPWKLQLQNEVKEGDKHDQENSKFWRKEREFFGGRIDLFLYRMRIVQGNRVFSEWDGSVTDSIVGVYLTQNVSDHLSSSAFMSLAAAFPYQPSCNPELSYAESYCKQSKIVGIEEVVDTETLKLSCGNSDEQTLDEDINIGSPTFVGSNMVSDKEAFTQEATNTVEYENQVINGLVFSRCDIEDHERLNRVNSGASPEDCYVELPSDNECLVLRDAIEDNSFSSFNEEKQKGRKLKADAGEINNKGVHEKHDWDDFKRRCENQLHGKRRETRHSDSIDWQAVRQANVNDIAEVIKIRGQHNNIAKRIKDFLNEVNKDHNEINLEWLRRARADTVRKYLTHIEGIGLKSVECVRLLALKEVAFPVDVNVGRIVIRLGWVPMQPLPEDVQIHVLEEMPVMDNIQKYLWPRLRHLTPEELYELHYHMITFGKVFCTKRNPNCQSCPMKNQCKYYLSAHARAKHDALPKSTEKQEQKKTEIIISSNHHSFEYEQQNSASQSHLEGTTKLESQMKDCEPRIEEPESPGRSSPEVDYMERDIEDFGHENPSRRFVTRSPYMHAIPERDIAALVPFMTPYDASFIRPDRLKIVHRLRTIHLVFEIHNEEYLYEELKLERLHPKDRDDNRPYLFAMCALDRLEQAPQPTQDMCNCLESKDSSCNGENTCSANNLSTEVDTVQGTILIPCRTAMRGRFPLNGTYFQVNEVFVDHESSLNPITIRKDLLQQRRLVYFGTSTSKILKGLKTYEIALCFKYGSICVRGFDRKTRRPEPLLERFHIKTVKTAKKGKRKSKHTEDE